MEFPSNSISQPEEPSKNLTPEKVIKKVVTGPAIRRKKSLGTRLRELLAPDGKSLYETVVQDVLAPALKDMFTDAVIQGVERMVHGEVRSSTRRSSSYRGPVGNASNISYNRYSASPTPHDSQRTTSRGRSHDFGQIEIHTRAEAEEIIAQMDEIIGRYGHTSVSDLYEMVGLETNYTDEKWGWLDLRGADVHRLRNGSYVLALPRAEAL